MIFVFRMEDQGLLRFLLLWHFCISIWNFLRYWAYMICAVDLKSIIPIFFSFAASQRGRLREVKIIEWLTYLVISKCWGKREPKFNLPTLNSWERLLIFTSLQFKTASSTQIFERLSLCKENGPTKTIQSKHLVFYPVWRALLLIIEFTHLFDVKELFSNKV